MINWKVRLKNKTFWLALIPAVLLLLQVILAACGIEFNPEEITGKIVAIVDALFLVLSILGIINDPTVYGLSDSTRALAYEKPAPNAKEVTNG